MFDSLKLIYWNRVKTNQFYNQIEEYLAWKKLFSSDVGNLDKTLKSFMFHCDREAISYVSKEDINDYKVKLLNERTPFTMKREMATIRDFFRYWGARKVVCINSKYITDEGIMTNLQLSDILRNMTKKISYAEQIERNRELVTKRVKDPMTWSYGELAKYFNIGRSTAQQVFSMHLEKYAEPRQIDRYRKTIEETYA